jgi:hypothetical protein
MANRVVLGNDGSNYVLKVSKPGQNVLTASNQNLTFDSSAVRTGQVYAGGANLNLGDSSQNFLTTSSKPNLGYIPLVLITEKNNGEVDPNMGGGEELFVTNISTWEFTSSTIQPVSFEPDTPSGSGTMASRHISNGRHYDNVSNSNEDAQNVYFNVLRIPCAYGYMTSTYFG